MSPGTCDDAHEVLDFFGCDHETGLSTGAQQEKLKQFGPNILPESVPRSGWSIFAEQFKSLPVALLGAAAAISVATGGLADAVVIMSVVGINAVIGYVTESGSERTIHSLKNLVRPSALVVRDARVCSVGVEAVVPGDLLVLRPGTYVAADARLVEAQYLSVDESALTGESMPAGKTADALDDPDLPLADRINMVFMGTLVTGGQGLAVVTATGGFTQMGQIQTMVGEARAPSTPMEQQLDHMGTQLALISGAVCGGVFLIGLLRGYGFLQMLKSSISLAVAAVPEGLPAVATTTLALGIRNMRRQNVLVRRLEAIETLGSVQTICLDKTGTLTLNRMSVTEVFVGMEGMRVWDGKFLSPAGYQNPYSCEELLKLLHVSVLCNESEVFGSEEQISFSGSSTENALLNMALTAGVSIVQVRQSFPLVKIVHRSETRNMMLTIHATAGGPAKIIAVKGSPPEVLALCTWHIKDGVKLPLSEEEREAILAANEEMAGRALRVLGCAYAMAENGVSLGDNGDIEIDDLMWLGIVGMKDPVRPGVKQLIGQFHGAGIDTIMITGDQSATAYAIGKELNLSAGKDLAILDSRHLSDMPPEVFKALSKSLHVFARVSPAHKLEIVQVLQETGRVVAMTGDGINDGPALKAAGIGIAMGHTGTDVAREVADVVLEDDNLETMVVAISQGRTIYNNIRKSVHFLLSTNMSEIMVMFTCISAGLGEPLTAMQLLWINLISDIFPGLALALEATGARHIEPAAPGPERTDSAARRAQEDGEGVGRYFGRFSGRIRLRAPQIRPWAAGQHPGFSQSYRRAAPSCTQLPLRDKNYFRSRQIASESISDRRPGRLVRPPGGGHGDTGHAAPALHLPSRRTRRARGRGWGRASRCLPTRRSRRPREVPREKRLHVYLRIGHRRPSGQTVRPDLRCDSGPHITP